MYVLVELNQNKVATTRFEPTSSVAIDASGQSASNETADPKISTLPVSATLVQDHL